MLTHKEGCHSNTDMRSSKISRPKAKDNNRPIRLGDRVRTNDATSDVTPWKSSTVSPGVKVGQGSVVASTPGEEHSGAEVQPPGDTMQGQDSQKAAGGDGQPVVESNDAGLGLEPEEGSRKKAKVNNTVVSGQTNCGVATTAYSYDRNPLNRL